MVTLNEQIEIICGWVGNDFTIGVISQYPMVSADSKSLSIDSISFASIT